MFLCCILNKVRGDILKENIFSNLIIKDVFSAMTIFTEENAKAKKINRPCWAIIIKYEGETMYYCNGKEIISNCNNPVILPKGCSYEWRCVKAGRYAVIEFECDMTSNEMFSFTTKNSEKIVRMCKAVEYKLMSQKPMYKIESIKDTYSIILKFTEDLQQRNRQKKSRAGPSLFILTGTWMASRRKPERRKK